MQCRNRPKSEREDWETDRPLRLLVCRQAGSATEHCCCGLTDTLFDPAVDVAADSRETRLQSDSADLRPLRYARHLGSQRADEQRVSARRRCTGAKWYNEVVQRLSVPRRAASSEERKGPANRGLSERVSEGTRTPDRLDHNQELYQLSYAHRGGLNLATEGPAA
jgi:hypothetical protein